jgi:hypothetical protein
MKLTDERRRSSYALTSGRSWRAILGACLWITGGVIALLALCLLGPVLVTYATAADLPILVLTLLVSSIAAGWDASGLMLIMVGVDQLMTACGRVVMDSSLRRGRTGVAERGRAIAILAYRRCPGCLALRRCHSNA